MNLVQSLILSVVQGVSEFLPISSSGHLNLVQHFMGTSPSLTLDIFLNTATFCSVLYFFRNKISYFKNNLPYIIIGSTPTALVGIFFRDKIETIFSNPKFIPFFFLVTTFFVLLTKWTKKSNSKMDVKKAIIIGLFQAVAILPGVSRAGSTIFASLILGLSSEEAFNYSFSLFVPASIGAILFIGTRGLKGLNIEVGVLAVSFIVTFLLGLLALSVLKKSLTTKKFWMFSLYTFSIAIISFLFV